MSEKNIILNNAKSLRYKRQFNEAYIFLKNQPEDKIHRLCLNNDIQFHHPIWWKDIQSKNVRLTRRKKEDAEFIQLLWRNETFIRQFHPLARHLNTEIAHLRNVLEKEYVAILPESKSLHWVIRNIEGKAFGLLSLTDICSINKRAELLIGILPNAPFGTVITTMLMVFDFFFNRINFKKLYSQVLADNSLSFKTALHLGFKEEGLIRSHIYLDSRYHDVYFIGLLKEDVISNSKLIKRLC